MPVDDEKADNGDGPIAPSLETVQDGTYQPLSRPLFIYVSDKALARPEVQQFVDFYLANGGDAGRGSRLRAARRRRAISWCSEHFKARKTGHGRSATAARRSA